jgi:hypothetical protein
LEQIDAAQGVEARHFRIALPSDTISILAGMVCYYRNATGKREPKQGDRPRSVGRYAGEGECSD